MKKTCPAAVLALCFAANGAPAQTISNHAWQRSTAAFSAYHFRNGTELGSRYFLLNGRGPGSLYFFFNGVGFGSAYFYRYGTSAGSRYFVRNGTGPGSSYHWRNGTGCLSNYFWQRAAADEQARRQCPANGTGIVLVVTLCLTGDFTLPPCEAILQAVAERPETMRRLEQVRQSFGR